MSTHFLSGKKVVVAGAGLGGLSFALALKQNWPRGLSPPQVVVFDRDPEAGLPSRAGTSLSLVGSDETGGLVALRDLGLLDQVLQHAILGMGDNSAFKIWDSAFNELISVRPKPLPGLPTAGIRVARRNLRQALIDGAKVADIEIRWELACLSGERLSSGGMRAHLADGSAVDCDLLIAADGANSKLRASLRPQNQLSYAGAVGLGAQAKFPEGIPAPIAENWGVQFSGQGVVCFYSPVDRHTVIWSVIVQEATQREALKAGGTPEQHASIIAEARKHGEVFGDLFRTVVDATEDPSTAFCVPARDLTPFRHDVANDGPAVFIGDACHAVSPAAGYGANLALKDGWDLARLCCESTSLEEAVKAYDNISVPRAEKVLKSSHWRMELAHWTGIKWLAFRSVLVIGGFMLRLKGQA